MAKSKLASALSSSLCSSQGSSRRASARREGAFQPKGLGGLDSRDRHGNEGGGGASACEKRRIPYRALLLHRHHEKPGKA
ncbi:hypothetical protein CFBP6626_02645 [Agrobacterium tumefaciens]|nr:hypothetical protein CFBP6626_02645 [Agrobacterium tumefaciens]